jgi:hypothetical protein
MKASKRKERNQNQKKRTESSNKNNMTLPQKQTQRLMEQNRRPKHKSTQLQPPDFWQRSPKHI